ncbi:acyltransferase family protein [Ornithinimicrobium pratense]|uniref:acyltransferase family protein n=1 Tax=Ornithinimicrobium pratense TaxID=2593973 RepID=UPI001787FC18|nr:acyltransferase family protein [Ornithinimicrobium pratense]
MSSNLRPPEPPPSGDPAVATGDPVALPGEPAEPAPVDQPLTRRRHLALQAARHALRIPPVPRHFRADIEGLRAVAVLGVLLWHAGVAWFPGGFTGVDVFFVVSGFLMSSLLLEEARERGRIDIGRFYARRARRLLPAALTALVGTAVLTLLLLPRSRWAEIGGDLLASATFLVNWRMASRSVDYLDLERAPSPLQHYWSLAVEEQFYLIWPILLLLILLVAKGRARVFTRLSWTTTLALFAGSLWLSWWWTQQDPSAYFVTPTRIFELMLGALVALGALAWPRIPRALAAAVGWGGLGMVAASLLLIDADTPFPGTWALLPTVGTAMVLIAGPAAGPWGPVAVLRHVLLQWVGRLSYSLYLWHWPFVAIAADLAGVGRGGPDVLPVQWGLLAVLVSVVPAWLSFRYIEDPVRRHGRTLAGQLPAAAVTWRTLRLGLNCILTGALLGVVVLASAPSSATRADAQWRTPAVVDELREPVGAGTLTPEDDLLVGDDPSDDDAPGAGPDAAPTPDGSGATAGPGDGPARTAAPGRDPQEVAAQGAAVSATLGEPLPQVEIPRTVGDLAVPLEQVPDDRPVLRPEGCFVSLTDTDVGVCEAGDPDGEVTIALAGDSHAGMWVTALDEIGRDRGWRVLVLTKSSCPPAQGLVVRRSGQAGDYTQCSQWQEGLTETLEEQQPDLVLLSSASYGRTGAEAVADGLAARVQQVAQTGALPALIRDVPRAPFDVPACLAEHQDDVPQCAFARADGLARAGTGHDLLAERVPELPILDFTDATCPGRTCSPIVGGVVVWRDSNHLSATYIRSLRDVVEAEVAPLVALAVLGESASTSLERGSELGG